jgi:3-dehydroquinate synthetase
VIKTGLLAGGRLWEMVCDWEPGRGSTEQRLELIRRCAAYKAHVVSIDPREQGLRAVLNLGHSIGHAIEAAAGFEIPHGEAVAVGLLQSLWLSTRVAGLDPAVERETRALVKRHGLPTLHRGVDAAAVREALRRDKKARSGRVRFVLLEAVGKPVWGVDVDDALIDEAIARAV